MAGRRDLYGFWYLGYQAVQVEGTQERDIALLFAEQIRNACQWMKPGVAGICP
jgi:hypothetical protein